MKPKLFLHRNALGLALAASLLAVTHFAYAVDYVWDGTGSGTTWSTGANWVGDPANIVNSGTASSLSDLAHARIFFNSFHMRTSKATVPLQLAVSPSRYGQKFKQLFE